MAHIYHCDHCTSNPCLWKTYCQQIIEECGIFEITQELADKDDSSRRFHFHAYKTFVRMHHGPLGCSHRVKISECVLLGIHACRPDVNGKYIGHQDAPGRDLE